ncbi:glycerol-3-phosphate dehydrogenase/oxidase, partial [Roseisolibacter sp. H3M3-2]|uniref:glycerol-3-phosphate dehydrogenase/oxidase n=1 Tax=Roseisolibacter sp. H3M3-2 TaxID=3031323 RepID=UPI0023DA4E0E
MTAPRTAALARLAAEPVDLLVIGGGITGAGTARDAALRGLSVALVERDDFAAGTSSRSSRLVHGGVRYLEHGHLGLVFEASRERRTLLRTAPHLVRPLRFTWPVYRGARVPRWKLVAGLALYDALALWGNVARHRPLAAAGVLAHEPALATEGLVGGATYWDAATDDARLTLATALDAAAAGACVLNHAQVCAMTLPPAPGGETRLRVHDRVGGDVVEVRARAVVNAAGPWGDAVRRLAGGGGADAVLGAKGVHLAVPAHRVGNRGAVTLLSQVDGRVMFVLPAGAFTIIGTTETPAERGPDEVRATEADVEYLLRSADAFFPGARLTRDDVVSAWAGIRPLAARHGDGRGTASASREHAIERDPRGLVSVSGGKLTTYRAMAAQVFDAAAPLVRRTVAPSATAARPLSGTAAPEAL